MFVPDGFPKTRTRFGSGLLSWCMYQILVGGQNMLRVQSGLERLFGIRLDISTLYRFKGSIADFYETQRYGILDSLMKSPVLYVDETSANLRSEAGYVWCITDGSSAFYCYRGSREGRSCQKCCGILKECWFRIFTLPMMCLSAGSSDA